RSMRGDTHYTAVNLLETGNSSSAGHCNRDRSSRVRLVELTAPPIDRTATSGTRLFAKSIRVRGGGPAIQAARPTGRRQRGRIEPDPADHRDEPDRQDHAACGDGPIRPVSPWPPKLAAVVSQRSAIAPMPAAAGVDDNHGRNTAR